VRLLHVAVLCCKQCVASVMAVQFVVSKVGHVMCCLSAGIDLELDAWYVTASFWQHVTIHY
jgi:hypothetical protein